VQLIAYLCVGFPREFRDRPMLEEVGWRPRLNLDTLIYRDVWGQTSELCVEPTSVQDTSEAS